MSKIISLHNKRWDLNDINDKSTATEVLRVQDKMVQDKIDSGMHPAQAARLTHEQIRQRTGQSHDKQFKVKHD